MKKTIAVILVLIAAVSMFTACGSSGRARSSSKAKYDYVTNKNGTRTWYETDNDHIVRVD